LLTKDEYNSIVKVLTIIGSRKLRHRRRNKPKPVVVVESKPQLQEKDFIRREAIKEANRTGETVQRVLDRWDEEFNELQERTNGG
jgi:hypothetical protein